MHSAVGMNDNKHVRESNNRSIIIALFVHTPLSLFADVILVVIVPPRHPSPPIRSIIFNNTQYPKAKYHLLLMRRKICKNTTQQPLDLCNVQTLNDLEPYHINEIREFHTLGRLIASRIVSSIVGDDNPSSSSSTNNIVMKLGYHALPSFGPLHLHIISSDLDSVCITKRKHIVSFTSPLFFVEPEAVERHLESAFVGTHIPLLLPDDGGSSSSSSSMRMTVCVRKERAQSVLDNTPMMCTRCEQVATTVPEWKRHNQHPQQCIKNGSQARTTTQTMKNVVMTTTTTGKLNSLLGWKRKSNNSTMSQAITAAAAVIKPTVKVTKTIGIKRSCPTTTTTKADEQHSMTRYIMPMTPTHFTISSNNNNSSSKSRFLIYMAIQEKVGSNFALGLAHCHTACPTELHHCLQQDSTRHITMYDGWFTSNQVYELTYNCATTDFDKLDIELVGWKHSWDSGAYLGICEKSTRDLKRLLANIVGIPQYNSSNETEVVKCNHLSIYRRRKQTSMSYNAMKYEFNKLRNATNQHDWGSVEGISIRVKEYGSSYDNCRVLVECCSN